MRKRIAILGSTGSIGTQALEVIQEQHEAFEVSLLTAGSNAALLIEQALLYKPNMVVIADESKYDQVSKALFDHGIKVYAGSEAIAQCVQFDSIDVVLTAMVGFSGLIPTIKAIEAKKTIALANKETLVVAGHIITELAKENGVNILPVDSEHSAIFQCLVGEFHNPIEKIVLTASGGPFRGKTRQDLVGVTKEAALNHPNWAMGAKITVDSATMMNKGLEVIEAQWLFGLKPEQIEVIVHKESIMHSFVQFRDGSMKAQMGLPDMKLPIQFALTYPNRLPTDFKRFDFSSYASLHFEQADKETFINLQLAYEAMGIGGSAPCVLNAANEVTNAAFLNGNIAFLDIGDINQQVMNGMQHVAKPTINDLIEIDTEARLRAKKLIK